MNICKYCREYLKEKSSYDRYKAAVIVVVFLMVVFFDLYLWLRVPIIALLITAALIFLVRFIGKALQAELQREHNEEAHKEI